MNKCIFVCILTLATTISMAQTESQTEYNFLRLPVSAHVAAMGGENITMVDDDALMVFHNPALLIGSTQGMVSLAYMNYMSGCNYATASYNNVFEDKWYYAVGVRYMGYGTMKHRDVENNDLGDFSASDIAFSASLGYELARNLSGGITAKYVYGYIESYKSMAIAVDLGLNWYLPESEWSFGFCVKNLGGQVKSYNDNFEKMPLDVQLGVSKRLVGSPLRLSATLVDLNHTGYALNKHLCIGAELEFSPEFYVAGGYNFRRAAEMTLKNSDLEESSHGAGLSFGAGLNMERFRINAAYSKYHVSSSCIVLNVSFVLY